MPIFHYCQILKYIFCNTYFGIGFTISLEIVDILVNVSVRVSIRVVIITNVGGWALLNCELYVLRKLLAPFIVLKMYYMTYYTKH